MHSLAWPTAKAQLYLLESAHVKEKIGRERIHRNKDALRELRCLQEILADLHTGELTSAPPGRRGELETAASRWTALQKLAAVRGITPDELVELPNCVSQFLRSWSAANLNNYGLPLGCGSDAADSTRAPSTAGLVPSISRGLEVAELDSASVGTATDRCKSETAAYAGDIIPVLPARTSAARLSHAQLDQLSAELQEQLEQEYISLIASIEEIQAMIEAEVAGSAPLPSRSDLEAFIRAADVVLRGSAPSSPKRIDRVVSLNAALVASVAEEEQACFVPIQQCQQDFQETERRSSSSSPISSEAPSYHAAKASVFPETSEAPAKGSCTPLPAAVTTELPDAAAVGEPSSENGCDCAPPSPTLERALFFEPEESESAAAFVVPQQRARWADLSDSEHDQDVDDAPCVMTQRCVERRSSKRSTAHAPATAPCCTCGQLLPRSAFSRRAWQQARRLHTTDSSHDCNSDAGALCLTCSKSKASPAADVGHRRARSNASRRH